MQTVRKTVHWWIAGVGLACLAASAGLSLSRPDLQAQEQGAKVKGATAENLETARELSTAFRQVAKQALPAIVSIESRGRVAKTADHGQDEGQAQIPQFDENSPFYDLFRNNPELKEFFRRNPRGFSTPQRPQPKQGMGSGFIIDPSGIIMTNNHVVADAANVKIRLHDGREYNAIDIKTDDRSDVAIVRIKPDGPLPSVPLGNSDSAEIGDWVLAIGSPFGLDATVTQGIISAKSRGPNINEREDFLQTDAAINPGNSGGPLINLRGEVIGINTAISTRSGGYDGVGFAIPVNMAKWVADQLTTNGRVRRAYLGIAMQEVNSDIARSLNLPTVGGALVNTVVPGSPAEAAKFEQGDLVRAADGKPVRSPKDLQLIVEQMPIGSTYAITVYRNGKEMKLNVEAREMPQDYSLSSSSKAREQDDGASKSDQKSDELSLDDLGMSVQSLSSDLAKQLPYATDGGVLISKVTEGSIAASAGLQPGLVVEKVGQTRVNSPKEFQAAMKNLKLDTGILLLVRTQRGTQFVVLRSAAPDLPETSTGSEK